MSYKQGCDFFGDNDIKNTYCHTAFSTSHFYKKTNPSPNLHETVCGIIKTWQCVALLP